MFFRLWWDRHQEWDLEVYKPPYSLSVMNPTALYGAVAMNAVHFMFSENADLDTPSYFYFYITALSTSIHIQQDAMTAPEQMSSHLHQHTSPSTAATQWVSKLLLQETEN